MILVLINIMMLLQELVNKLSLMIMPGDFLEEWAKTTTCITKQLVNSWKLTLDMLQIKNGNNASELTRLTWTAQLVRMKVLQIMISTLLFITHQLIG